MVLIAGPQFNGVVTCDNQYLENSIFESITTTILTSEFNPALCKAHKSIPVAIDTDISL